MTSDNLTIAARFAPLIERVHGGHHPEFTRVRQITAELQRPISVDRATALFRELRAVTHGYALPGDVCGAVEATYEALERSDRELAA